MLAPEEERAVLALVGVEAKRAGMLEVSKVHALLERHCGKPVSRPTTYNMLHRHGWRKIAPRPRHPKADAVAQEAFKKTGPRASKRQGKKPQA